MTPGSPSIGVSDDDQTVTGTGNLSGRADVGVDADTSVDADTAFTGIAITQILPSGMVVFLLAFMVLQALQQRNLVRLIRIALLSQPPQE